MPALIYIQKVPCTATVAYGIWPVVKGEISRTMRLEVKCTFDQAQSKKDILERKSKWLATFGFLFDLVPHTSYFVLVRTFRKHPPGRRIIQKFLYYIAG